MTAMEFLAYQSKVAVCLAVLYLFFRVLMGGVRLHALNRCLVLLSMLLSAVLPLVVITVHLDWNSAMPLVAQGTPGRGGCRGRWRRIPLEGTSVRAVLGWLRCGNGLDTDVRAFPAAPDTPLREGETG